MKFEVLLEEILLILVHLYSANGSEVDYVLFDAVIAIVAAAVDGDDDVAVVDDAVDAAADGGGGVVVVVGVAVAAGGGGGGDVVAAAAFEGLVVDALLQLMSQIQEAPHENSMFVERRNYLCYLKKVKTVVLSWSL